MLLSTHSRSSTQDPLERSEPQLTGSWTRKLKGVLGRTDFRRSLLSYLLAHPAQGWCLTGLREEQGSPGLGSGRAMALEALRSTC